MPMRDAGHWPTAGRASSSAGATHAARGKRKKQGDLFVAEFLWFSPVRLAPASCLRRREVVADGWEGWLTAYPDALKKANDRVRARRLVKLFSKAKMVDGEIREKLGCRRSGRLSSPAIPATAALGTGRSMDVKLIEDGLKPLEADLKPIEGVLDLGCLLPSMAEETNLTTGESLEALNPSCCEDDESVTRPMIFGLYQPPFQVGAISPSLLPLTRSAEIMSCGSMIGEEEMGAGIDGSGSMTDGLTSVHALSMPHDSVGEHGESSLLVHYDEDGEMLPRMLGGVLAGELPLDSEEAAALVVDGAVEGDSSFCWMRGLH
ncbi:hypothetical protein Dimus_010818 [Dionaea muscipula]